MITFILISGGIIEVARNLSIVINTYLIICIQILRRKSCLARGAILRGSASQTICLASHASVIYCICEVFIVACYLTYTIRVTIKQLQVLSFLTRLAKVLVENAAQTATTACCIFQRNWKIKRIG